MLWNVKATKKLKGKPKLLISYFSDEWDILWVERDAIYEILNHTHLQQNQKVNHFRNHFELTRKDLMVKNLKRKRKELEKEGKFDEAAT